jgi:hypothetical protein
VARRLNATLRGCQKRARTGWDVPCPFVRVTLSSLSVAPVMVNGCTNVNCPPNSTDRLSVNH